MVVQTEPVSHKTGMWMMQIKHVDWTAADKMAQNTLTIALG